MRWRQRGSGRSKFKYLEAEAMGFDKNTVKGGWGMVMEFLIRGTYK